MTENLNTPAGNFCFDQLSCALRRDGRREINIVLLPDCPFTLEELLLCIINFSIDKVKEKSPCPRP